MTFLSEETRGKILVITIMFMCATVAVLMGVAIYELPWPLNKPSLTPVSKLSQAEAIGRGKLAKIEKSGINASQKVQQLLEIFPVIDGHNDLPWNMRNLVQNKLERVNLSLDLKKLEPWASYNESFTDIPRLRQGKVGAQFWVAYGNVHTQGKDAVVQVLEQIDVIMEFMYEYPDTFQFCTSAKCIMETSFFQAGGVPKIASLIGVEGGHLIRHSAGVLRQLYRLGVRYLTLTHSASTPWADASPVDDPTKDMAPINAGLSPWGLELIDEMNRLGMMIDLSHVSEATMIDALERSRAPVIFSHSGAKGVCNVHRNVADHVLRKLKSNGGIIMVNFYSDFVKCDQSTGNATLLDVVRHIEYIRDLIGVEHLGIGADYDGVDSMPHGLEDVSKYPDLFIVLLERGWTLDDLSKISFRNLIRVFEEVEQVRNTSKDRLPMSTILLESELLSKNFSVDGLSDKSLAKLELHKREREFYGVGDLIADQPVDSVAVPTSKQETSTPWLQENDGSTTGKTEGIIIETTLQYTEDISPTTPKSSIQESTKKPGNIGKSSEEEYKLDFIPAKNGTLTN